MAWIHTVTFCENRSLTVKVADDPLSAMAREPQQDPSPVRQRKEVWCHYRSIINRLRSVTLVELRNKLPIHKVITPDGMVKPLPPKKIPQRYSIYVYTPKKADIKYDWWKSNF